MTNGYMLFSARMREEHPEKFAGMRVPEQGKLLGAMWRSLSEDEKQEYRTMAAVTQSGGRRRRR